MYTRELLHISFIAQGGSYFRRCCNNISHPTCSFAVWYCYCSIKKRSCFLFPLAEVMLYDFCGQSIRCLAPFAFLSWNSVSHESAAMLREAHIMWTASRRRIEDLRISGLAELPAQSQSPRWLKCQTTSQGAKERFSWARSTRIVRD